MMKEKNLQLSDAISIAYRDNEAADRPVLLLLHSLSDNSFAFEGMISAGLNDRFRIIAPDLRGRGGSSRPATGYRLEDHADDVIGLLDALGIEQAFVAGHSFGGFLGLYVAAHFRTRVIGLALIDAATELNPLTPAFVTLLTDRLGKWYPDQETYLLKMRAAPFVRYWDADMRRCFLADTTRLSDDSLIIKTQKAHILQCALALQAVTKKEWRHWALRVGGPSLVIRAAEPFIDGQFLVSERQALETAVLLPQGACCQVPGNHLTMLFGAGGKAIASRIIDSFSKGPEPAPSRRRDMPASPPRRVYAGR